MPHPSPIRALPPGQAEAVSYWLWAPVLATTTLLAVLLFAPTPPVL
jgi:hypothetical protein